MNASGWSAGYQRRYVSTSSTLVAPDVVLPAEPGRLRAQTALLEPEDLTEGAVDHLAKTPSGLKQVGHRDLVSARLANEQGAGRSSTSRTATRVLEVYRTSFAEDQTPIRVTVTVYPADRNQLVYDAGQVSERSEEPVRP